MEKMNFTFEQFGNVGIFNLTGELTAEHEDELYLLLMRAIHSDGRSVLNLKKVTRIDLTCLKLLEKACCASIRLKNAIILTELPKHYLSELFNLRTADSIKTEQLANHGKSAV
ncbi:MAG TPA: hypothetical protein ENG83_03345 [Nitrospirae bacterium]|nr:hypothetical protein BMS3Abin06_02724 [bacterium BMS3Abin06]HDH11229.1 hypothetical protein [Nitrospirota bacterium]HDZ02470.1 hypothetical protein [Nitrospirota bacterium]